MHNPRTTYALSLPNLGLLGLSGRQRKLTEAG
jgi:hypothetical protein